MIFNKFLSAVIFLFGLVMFLISAPQTTVQAQTGALKKAIGKHIETVREDASENEEAREILYGDIDGDGDKDAVVFYTLEGFGGGNSWGQKLVVFINTKGKYKAAGDEVVGGKFFRTFILKKIVGREIIGMTETCPNGDPQGICKNPKKKQVKYVLIKGKLKEK